MPKVTVRKEQLPEFKKQIGETDCKLTGRQRRSGTFRIRHSGVRIKIVDVEIELPPLGWRGSMTDAIYDLPGVISYGTEIFPGGRLGRILEWCYWHLGRSKI